MPTVREAFVSELDSRYGPLKRVGTSRSLYEVADGSAMVYVRYSRVHRGETTFYGLRDEDLRRMTGLTAFIALLWDGQKEPLLLPLDEFAGVFKEAEPAADGQFKVQVRLRDNSAGLYVARAGHHNVEPYFGWWPLVQAVEQREDDSPQLNHSQIQTLLGAIGHARGLDVWIPLNDRSRMDWSLTPRFECRNELPAGFDAVEAILREIDVLWIRRGSNELEALYEVEHSTPIYSGLLRLNDIRLSTTSPSYFAIVSDGERRDGFVRQLRRPTFRASGLADVCGFMPYPDVFRWHRRIEAGLADGRARQ